MHTTPQNTIILPIERKWFDMINSGIKKEEYREIKPYYETRLARKAANNEIKYIEFRNGYGLGVARLVIEFKGLKAGFGNTAWGAPQKPVFIISLGDILVRYNCTMQSIIDLKIKAAADASELYQLFNSIVTDEKRVIEIITSYNTIFDYKYLLDAFSVYANKEWLNDAINNDLSPFAYTEIAKHYHMMVEHYNDTITKLENFKKQICN